ncbi:hypothetical protein LOK49_LG01G01040 [Camellia lanceoleosa]|uniref:Uncharacterized protein n=1 Tax=Camellia lanceoleosa TaxID=1840588 RepID=A0ACC0J4N0_9ERIC|nr:hypothetical protein LOK49_LG01G01040 [Camellia lanceoleosa]
MVCIKRKKRLGELRQAAKVQRYGSMVPISGSDFVREVSQAPPDVWLATKYPTTKFVKIISTDCIPNYPDCNLSTLLVYNNGAVKANYVGLHNFGRRCTPEAKDVEDVKSAPVMESLRPCKDVELSPSKDVEPRPFMDVEDPKLKLGKDIEELNSKLNVLESKFSEVHTLRKKYPSLDIEVDFCWLLLSLPPPSQNHRPSATLGSSLLPPYLEVPS